MVRTWIGIWELAQIKATQLPQEGSLVFPQVQSMLSPQGQGPQPRAPFSSYLSRKGRGGAWMWPKMRCTSFFTWLGTRPSPAPPGALPEMTLRTLWWGVGVVVAV